MSDSNQQLRTREAHGPELDRHTVMACRLQRHSGAKTDRALHARLLLVFLASTCGLLLPACRGSQLTETSNSGSASPETLTSTKPPFSTREPERYQAIRLVTVGASSSNSTTSPPNQASKVLIARDGAKRREEYISPANEHIIYLEIPAGRFVLLPASKLYADLAATQNEAGVTDPVDESAVVSTDELLNEAHHAAKYQTLGTEIIDGRTTTKYRVTTAKASSETNTKPETLVWIDEGLGMPVRSETTYGGEGSAKAIMELKDVRLEVDQRLFEIPGDYKKVGARLVQERIRRSDKATQRDQQ